MKELKIIFSLLILIMIFATWFIIFRAADFYVKKQKIWIEAYGDCLEYTDGNKILCVSTLNGREGN